MAISILDRKANILRMKWTPSNTERAIINSRTPTPDLVFLVDSTPFLVVQGSNSLTTLPGIVFELNINAVKSHFTVTAMLVSIFHPELSSDPPTQTQSVVQGGRNPNWQSVLSTVSYEVDLTRQGVSCEVYSKSAKIDTQFLWFGDPNKITTLDVADAASTWRQFKPFYWDDTFLTAVQIDDDGLSGEEFHPVLELNEALLVACACPKYHGDWTGIRRQDEPKCASNLSSISFNIKSNDTNPAPDVSQVYALSYLVQATVTQPPRLEVRSATYWPDTYYSLQSYTYLAEVAGTQGSTIKSISPVIGVQVPYLSATGNHLQISWPDMGGIVYKNGVSKVEAHDTFTALRIGSAPSSPPYVDPTAIEWTLPGTYVTVYQNPFSPTTIGHPMLVSSIYVAPDPDQPSSNWYYWARLNEAVGGLLPGWPANSNTYNLSGVGFVFTRRPVTYQVFRASDGYMPDSLASSSRTVGEGYMGAPSSLGRPYGLCYGINSTYDDGVVLTRTDSVNGVPTGYRDPLDSSHVWPIFYSMVGLEDIVNGVSSYTIGCYPYLNNSQLSNGQPTLLRLVADGEIITKVVNSYSSDNEGTQHQSGQSTIA
jgi:hypothetical protein